jgi:Tripartite tricarboxylate transporter TctB family
MKPDLVLRSKDFWAGVIFIAFGAAFIFIARDYALGSAVRMGPGYFPTMLGWLLVAIGLIVGAMGFFTAEPIQRGALRPFLILVAIVLFALALEPLGLVAATLVLIFVSALGGHEFHWVESLVLSAILIVVAVGVFWWGLGLQFKILPVQLGVWGL